MCVCCAHTRLVHARCRIQLYTAFFAILCVVSIIMLFFNFGGKGSEASYSYILIAMSAYGQITFSILLAMSIVQGARLNDAAVLHRYRLSRIETLICDFLVAAENGQLSGGDTSSDTPWYKVQDSPLQRQLRLTRQVASSLSQSLVVETAILPARVLFMPANFALLSTFGSLSMSAILSATKSLQ